jgi:hypothetical protein
LAAASSAAAKAATKEPAMKLTEAELDDMIDAGVKAFDIFGSRMTTKWFAWDQCEELPLERTELKTFLRAALASRKDKP